MLFAGALWSPLAVAQTVAGLDPHVVASEGSTPGSILLTWQPMSNSTGFTIRRRASSSENWSVVVQLPSSATSYEDATTEAGKSWEYNVRRGDAQGVVGNAYVLAGLEVPFRDDPGEVLIVTDEVSATELAEKLERLEGDLQGDGWTVQRISIAAGATPQTLKGRIEEAQAVSAGRLRSILLLGEVPRAFSGLIRPDGHPDHEGAWPADGYFADLQGSWTDVMNLGGSGSFANTGGDGKFDQSSYPADLTLAIGRVDTADMPAFAPLGAQDLLARYLDANHAYRHGLVTLPRRTLVVDNFGYFNGEAFARIAWRDGSAAFGSEPVAGGNFFDQLEADGGYALAFGCGGGNPKGASGVGTTSSFVTRKPQAAFMGLFGSYFGDWSYSDNFLRASLVSEGTTVAAAWFARPHLHLHSLGALRSFGDAFLESANNGGTDYDTGFAARGVHQALLGDPTLRLFVTAPPSGLMAIAGNGQVTLTWDASPATVVGYHIYRRGSVAGGAETRLTSEPVSELMFTDVTAEPNVALQYRVVAVERLVTGSGTFFNHSQGVIVEATATMPVEIEDAGVQLPGDGGAAEPSNGGVSGSGGGDLDPPAGCGCSSAGATGSFAFALAAGLWLLSIRRRTC